MTLTGESDELTIMRAQAEAAAWMALLHSPERNAAIEGGLKRWIAASPLHTAAWESATDVWIETEGLPRRIPRRPESPTRRALLVPLLAIAVTALTVAGVFVKHYLTSIVSTAVGEQRTLNLDDGTRVTLNTDSHIRMNYGQSARTVILESGEAYFQVAHDRRPFTVIAGESKILALGTSFTVRRDQSADDALTVTLIEGRVAVAPVDISGGTTATTANSDVTILNAGQRLRAHAHAQPAVDRPAIDKATGWVRGQLIFDHTPLREAAAEFSRYNKIKIIVASPEAARIPIGGIFRIGDSRSFARAVAASYDLKVTQHDDELILEPTPSPAPSEADGSATQ